ncbi:hypothetical protein [Sporosarcina sp. OR05]|uniref:hypothetical protein n=1 Tax=Sporosarcina sp. OR05 TaxID=2969819 RepID=UPI00352A1E99
MSNLKIITATYTDAQLHALRVLNNLVADAIDRNMQNASSIETFLNSGLAQYGLVTTIFTIPKIAKYGTLYGLAVAIATEIVNMHNTLKQDTINGLRGGYYVIDRIRSNIQRRGLYAIKVKYTTLSFHGTDYFNGNYFDDIDRNEPRVDYLLIAGQFPNGQWEYYD